MSRSSLRSEAPYIIGCVVATLGVGFACWQGGVRNPISVVLLAMVLDPHLRILVGKPCGTTEVARSLGAGVAGVLTLVMM